MKVDNPMQNIIIRKITAGEVATAIFNYLLKDILNKNPSIIELTLNSSPYAIPFYLKLGFEPTSEEQEIDGIRFTPMKYVIKD